MGTELLIPFIASVIITLLVRRLDRSNYRLSQIKKFTGKLSDDINQAAMTGIQSVKDTTIDLEIMNKQARKLISEVNGKSEEIKKLLESLKSNKDYLDSISNDLKGIVKLTNEIRTESEFVQEGMKVIQVQRDELKVVETELSDIQSEVHGLVHGFNEKLNSRTQDILESLASKIVELENLLEVKSDKVDESLTFLSESFKSKLKEETEMMIQETVGKVELANQKMDDFGNFVRDGEKTLEIKMMRFKDNTEAIADKIERLDARLEEKADSVGSAVTEKLNSFERKFQERLEAIYDQLTQNKEAFISGIKMEVDAIKAEIEGLSLETMTRRDEILNDTRRQAETMNASIQTFQEKYLEAENKLLRQADQKKSDLFKDIDRFEEEFRRVSENFKTDTEEKRDSINKLLINIETEMNKATSSIEMATREKFISLKNELEDSMLQLHNKKKAVFIDELGLIDQKIKDLGKETMLKIKSVDDHFFDLKNALLESAKDIIARVENEASRINDNLDKEKNRVDQKIEIFMDSWASELEKIKLRSQKDIEGLNDRLKSIHIEGKELVETFRSEYVNGKTRMEEVVKKYQEGLTVKTDSIVDDIQNRVKKSQDEAEVLLSRLQKAGLNLYEKQESLLTSYGEKLYKELQNKLEKARYESEELLEDIQKAGMNLLEKQEEKIDKLNNAIDERISRQLTIMLDKGQLQLGQLESKISNYLQDVKLNIENTIKNAKEDSERQISNFNTHIQKSFKDIEKANIEFLDSSRNEFTRTKEEFGRIRTGLDSDMGKITDIKKNLMEYLNEESDKIKNILSTMSEKMNMIDSYSYKLEQTEKTLKESESMMEKVSTMIEKVRSEGDNLSSYMKSLEMIKVTKKEIENELRSLDSHKLKIEQIENELERATNVCNIINERTEELHDKITTITSIDNKLIQIEKIQNEMESRISEIKVVNERLGEISTSIQNTNRSSDEVDEKLQRLMKEVEKLEIKELELIDNLSDIETKTQVINSRNLDFKSMDSKFDKVENLMSDLSARHKQVITMQSRIEKLKLETEEMKNGFENLLVEADDKFEKLSQFLTVVNNTVGNYETNLKPAQKKDKFSREDTELIKRKKATVLNLYQNFDWTTDTIAEKLNMEKALVDAIVNNK